MDSSFGEGYISQVKQRQTQTGQYTGEFEDKKNAIVTIAGDVALDQLRNILIVINGISFFVIPAISWYLAKKSLAPVKRAHEKQKQFVSDASHELRTPISIMTGEIDVALTKIRPVSEYQSILKSNKEELTRLTSLVENLLFLAREDQQNTASLLDTVDITDLLSTLIVQLKPLYIKKHLTVYFQPAEESIVINGNLPLLRQLFFNLLDNAIKYTNKGEITITLNNDGKYTKVSIKDTGIGISKEHQTQLFDRFYRVESARSEIKGYGLGLAICQAVVKRHGGNIVVNSMPHKGSAFIVTFPKNL
jgi:signal transduction histidine kinase